MKTIGLLGGMSYESTTAYYQLINRQVQEQLGGSHSAKLLLYSFDYHELEMLLNEQKWDQISMMLVKQGKKLKRAGAEMLVLCANTMHIIAEQVEEQVGLPIIHIAKATAEAIKEENIHRILLMGTTYTMQSNMYPHILDTYNIQTVIPDGFEQAFIHQTIYEELIKGVYKESKKSAFIDMIEKYGLLGVQGVILGCTEIPLLIKKEDVTLKRFDTLDIHVKAIVKAMLNKN